MNGESLIMYSPTRLDAWTNNSNNWVKKKLLKDKQKRITEIMLLINDDFLPKLPVLVKCTRIGPRDIDDDNLPSCFKYVRDTIAEYYKVNDGTKSPLSFQYFQRRANNKEEKYSFILELSEVKK